jgi:hypothetical protein
MINGQSRDGIDTAWIASQIHGGRRDGQPVSVVVNVREAGIDVALVAGVCPPARPSRRRPMPLKARLFDIWTQCGLQGDPDVAAGRLVQCLRRIERAL